MKVNQAIVRIIIKKDSYNFRSGEIPMMKHLERDGKSIWEQLHDACIEVDLKSGKTPPNSNVIPFSPDQNTK